MKNKGFTTTEVVLSLAAVLVVSAAVFPMLGAARSKASTPASMNADRNSCMNNLKQISLSILAYHQDYDQKYPYARAGKTGWGDALKHYSLRSAFQCPADSAGKKLQTSDYFYNSRLSGVSKRSLKSISNIIMNGDGQGNASNSASLSALPAAWVKNPKSPAHRHFEGANYAFADGHVKWMRPKNAQSVPANVYGYTFAVR